MRMEVASFATVDSPLGPLLAAATERGLVRLAYEDGRRGALLADLAERLGGGLVEAPAALDRPRRQLDEYFQGRRRRFTLALDWTLTRGFGRRVLEAAQRIPCGRLATYGDIAARAGSARAARAAGSALGSNPLPIVVPCHRVVPAGGALGGYGGGPSRKEALLRLEGAAGGPQPPGATRRSGIRRS